MRSRVSKWVIPGILTVLLGTAATVQFTKSDIEQDLTSRSETALSSESMLWAKVHFDGRDALLSGLSPSQAQSEAATTILGALHGVRSVVHTVDIAPVASPYPFAAKISGEEVSIEGGVPDEAARKSLLDIAKPVDAKLELLSGIENRAKWLAAAEFALRQLRQMDQGQVALSDMTLSMSGRAKSRAAFETISIVLNAGFPQDVERGEVNITPPVQSPFDWNAEFDGERITMRGYVPNEGAIEQIGKAVPDGIVMTPDILLASGAPTDFAANAAALTSAFAHVSKGSAQIIDDKLMFSGDPVSPVALAQLNETLATSGVVLELSLPLVEPFSLSGEKSEDGIIYSGFVADEATRDRLSESGSVEDVSMGRGAPENYAAAIEFGNAVISPLERGRFSIVGEMIELGGNAATNEAYRDAQTALNIGPPRGFKLGEVALNITSPLPGVESLANPPAFVSETLGQEQANQPAGEVTIVTPELPNLEALSSPPTPPVAVKPDVEIRVDAAIPAGGNVETADNVEKPELQTEATPEAAETNDNVAILTPELPNLDALRGPPTPPVVTLTIDECRTQVAGIEQEHSILFNSGSTQLLETSAEPLDRLSAFFKACAKVEVHIEGHTDSDGPDNTNLALSVARAEAVVAELIARGISESRLYAVGYGESKPIADNNTRAGKAQNRRIAFEILETAE